MIPVDTDQRRHDRSWVSLALGVAIVAAPIALFALSDLSIEASQRGGVWWSPGPRAVPAHLWLTAPFVPSNVGALLSSLIFLNLAGPPLEWRIGRAATLALYLATSALGLLVGSGLLGATPFAAASGVAGLVGATAVLLWPAKASIEWGYSTVAFFRYYVWRGAFDAPYWVALVIWALVQALIAAFGRGSPAPFLTAQTLAFAAGAGAAIGLASVPALRPSYVPARGPYVRPRPERDEVGAWKKRQGPPHRTR